MERIVDSESALLAFADLKDWADRQVDKEMPARAAETFLSTKAAGIVDETYVRKLTVQADEDDDNRIQRIQIHLVVGPEDSRLSLEYETR